MDQETIIGFDAREIFLPYVHHERRLLRIDLFKSLSIDALVWPSMFLPNITINGVKNITNWNNKPIPIEHQSADNLWRDLSAMQHFLSENPYPVQFLYWEIAISEFMDVTDNQALDGMYSPNEVNPAWILLGYDISNRDFRSTLSGYVYEENEIEPLRQKYSAHLNEYHLFTELNIAEDFADWAHERDRGLAPTFVNGLYLITKTTDLNFAPGRSLPE